MIGARTGAASPAVRPSNAGGSNLPDVATSAAHCRHVNYLRVGGIISGNLDGTFQPSQKVTRSEMAKFISNAFALGLD